MDNTQRQRLWVVLFAAGFEGGFIGLAWLAGWLFRQPPLEHFHWDLVDAAWGIAACLPMVLGAWALMRWPIGPLARIKQFSEEVIRPLFEPCTIFDLALISLLAGVGEELLFRGVLQPVLGRRLGPALGLIATSVLFGLFHPITMAYIVLAALIGVYFGVLLNLSENLLLVIVAHALYDFVVLVYLMRRAPEVRKGPDLS